MAKRVASFFRATRPHLAQYHQLQIRQVKECAATSALPRFGSQSGQGSIPRVARSRRPPFDPCPEDLSGFLDVVHASGPGAETSEDPR